MSFFGQIFKNFIQKEENSFVDVSKNIDKFDGININSLVVYAPKNIVEFNKVIDCIGSGQSIIINFSSIKKSQRQEFSNYLSGAIYAIKAKVFKLQNELFVIVPKSVKLATL